jgi:indole-3-glycerol phosphate synthase
VAETILDRIVASVRQRLDAEPAVADLALAAAAAAEQRRRLGLRSMSAALRRRRPAVIAECKHASPSRGLLRSPFDPVALASSYGAAGAAAISVVTEPDHFAGDRRWLEPVRAAVDLPVLRKDFIVSARQIEEAALLGADAVLLIQRLLDPALAAELVALAHRLHLEVLMELFVDEDPASAVASGADVIGVNARDLATFEVRLDRVEELAARIPATCLRVAESGIHDRDQLRRLAAAGYDAFLIGEHLVTADDPGAALRRLLGSP